MGSKSSAIFKKLIRCFCYVLDVICNDIFILHFEKSHVGKPEHLKIKLTVCSCHVTYAFQSESTL